MQLARGALALVVLVTIAVGAPGTLHGKVFGETPIAAACLDDPEMPVGIEVPASVAAPVISRVVVELAAVSVRFRPCSAGILLCAPKTSPPSERRSWV